MVKILSIERKETDWFVVTLDEPVDLSVKGVFKEAPDLIWHMYSRLWEGAKVVKEYDELGMYARVMEILKEKDQDNDKT